MPGNVHMCLQAHVIWVWVIAERKQILSSDTHIYTQLVFFAVSFIWSVLDCERDQPSAWCWKKKKKTQHNYCILAQEGKKPSVERGSCRGSRLRRVHTEAQMRAQCFWIWRLWLGGKGGGRQMNHINRTHKSVRWILQMPRLPWQEWARWM